MLPSSPLLGIMAEIPGLEHTGRDAFFTRVRKRWRPTSHYAAAIEQGHVSHKGIWLLTGRSKMLFLIHTRVFVGQMPAMRLISLPIINSYCISDLLLKNTHL